MGEKTEQASPKKLRDARKKGQVAKSQDLPSAFTFMVSVFTVMGLSSFFYSKISEFLIATFKLIPAENIAESIPNVFSQGLMLIFTVCIPVLAIVAFVGVLINFLSVGPVFAIEAFKPDIKKFNPITNLKAKFKLKTLIELLKSLFKIVVASYIIYSVVYDSIPTLIKAVSLPISGALLVFHAFLMQVVTKVGLFFVVVAIADFIYQKKAFAKEMMMEKFEVKQEYKNSEGDPQIKGKRKEIAREIAYSEGPAGGVKKSKAVVTNPIHLAVALAYDPEMDSAPYITAMGNGLLAERIIKLAKQYDKPILRNVNLAHKLWQRGEMYEYVPEETYEALAEIIKWLTALEEGTIDQEEYMEIMNNELNL